MKLSVLMITYNHERFIAQALDSVLMQQVNFPFEIVIGEDFSTDGTRLVVADYASRYPEIIKPLFREGNLGPTENFMQTFRACQGEYIALLEGDDYWTEPDKLQKQVDFLEAHPELAICFHNAYKLHEGTEQLTPMICDEAVKPVSTLDDLLRENFIPTLTALFRNRLFTDFPPWFHRVKYCDWALHVLNASHGTIGYIDAIMATYRLHDGGLTAQVRDVSGHHEYVSELIRMYRYFRRFLGNGYRRTIRAQVESCHQWFIDRYLQTNEKGRAFKHAVRYLVACPGFRSFRRLIRTGLLLLPGAQR